MESDQIHGASSYRFYHKHITMLAQFDHVPWLMSLAAAYDERVGRRPVEVWLHYK